MICRQLNVLITTATKHNICQLSSNYMNYIQALSYLILIYVRYLDYVTGQEKSEKSNV